MPVYDINSGNEVSKEAVEQHVAAQEDQANLFNVLPKSLRGRLLLAGALGIATVKAMTFGGSPSAEQASAIRHSEDAQLSQTLDQNRAGTPQAQSAAGLASPASSATPESH